MKQKQLPVHEWVIVVSLIGMLGLVVIISQINETFMPTQAFSHPETDKPLVVKNKKSPSMPLTIYVEGAVKNKGPVQVPKGATYADLLRLVDFLPEADLSAFQGNKKKLVEHEVIKVF